MYNSSFHIRKPISNNSFSKDVRKGRNLYVPNLVKGILDNLKLGNKIAFEECDENGNIISFRGLENFIKTEINGIPAYIFDNHNHAFYFWNEALFNGIIKGGTTLIHIDEHSDLAVPSEFLDENATLEEIFIYTNTVLNVGNYIQPAVNSGLVKKLLKVTGESELDNLSDEIKGEKNDIILNFDVDFFSPGMEYIDYNKKKKIIQEVANKSKLITIATSPFFIDQARAVEIIKDIFKN